MITVGSFEWGKIWATNIPGTICRVSPYVLAIVISGWQLVFGMKSHFIPENNDVLGLLALADGLHIASPASLYNYFYPFLYPLLIHFLPVGDRVAWLGAGSWLLNTVSLLLVAKICYRLTKASSAAVIAVLTLAFWPSSFLYFTTAGPDPLAVTLLLSAVALAITQPHARHGLCISPLIGLLAALSVVTRQHLLPLALCVLLIGVMGRARWSQLICVIGFLIPFTIQAVIAITAGHAPWTSSAPFEIYKQVTAFNWYGSGYLSQHDYSSVVATILSHQAQFGAEYAVRLSKFILPLAILATASILRNSIQSQRVMRTFFIASAIFALVVSLGWSLRAELALTPFVALAAGAIVATLLRSLPIEQRSYTSVTIVLFALLCSASTALPNGILTLYGRIGQEKARASVEELLTSTGQIESSSQVLTDDYELFFRNIPGNVPQTPGGWLAISANQGLPRPQVALNTVTELLCSTKALGIHVSIWRGGMDPFASPSVANFLSRGIHQPDSDATIVRGLADRGKSLVCQP